MYTVIDDWAFFSRRLALKKYLGIDVEREKQRALLEDAVVIYHLHQPAKYQIPDSLLVQNCMRKLRDGMDRRRP